MDKYQEAAKLLNLVKKAGARHSSRDNGLIQQLHDLACELGAECPGKEAAVHPVLRAAVEALVLRHPGHANQKTHGNRFGAGQAKESLRRLKDDKGAREQYKESARGKIGLTLNRDKIRVGSKKLALPKDGEVASGIGPRFGDKFTIKRTGKSKRTGKGEYVVETDKTRSHFYDSLNPAKDIERYLRFNV